MKKYLAKSKLKSVYVENGKATKVFAKTYNKSDVLYEALNTSRVEDAGVNIPKLLEVAVTDGKWSITSEYVEGPTLTQLIEKYPDKADDYIKKMVEYQISFQKKSNPLLLVLKDKISKEDREENNWHHVAFRKGLEEVGRDNAQQRVPNSRV